PNPEPGQKLTDVRNAEIIFLEKVAELHPDAEKPVVIGNCQAGWAAALIGGSRPEVVGPMVFNGSPLSYWGGVDGDSPMRYRGGLWGGAWLTSLANDLGNGRYDGAHLVAGFEDLNPANTYWTKQYNVYSGVDTEEKRYLDFEKWWNGFYMMNAEEIHFIVDSLFIGNKLESGELTLEDGTIVDLKKIREPIVVFASRGDNITPPQQALNWIVKVYKTADEIRRVGQVIVYMVHESIGHLGIFVSSSVARKEHKEIIGSFKMLDYLAPGLYEMVIEESDEKNGVGPYMVRFEEREMGHITSMDDGVDDEEDFRPVDNLSRMNDRFYRSVISPWVKTVVTENTAEMIRQMHPLRFSKYMFSDLNPFIAPFKVMAESVKENRRPVSPDNPFLALEKEFSTNIVSALNLFRDVRDATQELVFKSIYGGAWMKLLFPVDETEEATPAEATPAKKAEQLRKEAEAGGFVEAANRVIIAIFNADKSFDKSEYNVAEKIVLEHEELRKVPNFDMRRIVKQQAMLLQTDEELAINALPKLLKSEERRQEILRIAKQVISLGGDYPGRAAYGAYKRIQEVLGSGKASEL
ncbi:MAG: DUF3141 domain-containing protein, partial [Desulfobacterales bacterium]|nr:DUF3141 domain-containing protein [Desulfobacterales bacterium]